MEYYKGSLKNKERKNKRIKIKNKRIKRERIKMLEIGIQTDPSLQGKE